MSNSKNIVTLYELNCLVSKVIESEMPSEYWVEAELSECRESRGHCYMELIQKDERTATPIAKASAKCWANKWMLIRPGFERTTGQRLHAGMKVLLKVFAQFHEAYGFSWIVTDIDPTYTLGGMARKRQEIIRQLKEEGVFDLQKELQLPLFCQRIAVISSETAAGYGDFCNQLADNPYGFQFQTRLFPAIMQGEGVEQSIINALNRIFDLTKGQTPCEAEADSVTVPRDEYRLVQTPQTFDIQLLKAANRQPYNDGFTDDASVVESYGHQITLVEGNRENIKITTPYDLKIAEVLI